MDQHKKLYPPISLKTREKKSVAFCISPPQFDKTELHRLTTIDTINEKVILDGYEINNIPGFVRCNVNEIGKACIIKLHEPKVPGFDLCESLKNQETFITQLRQYQIPHYFLRAEIEMAMTHLIITNVTSKNGETILLVFGAAAIIYVTELKRQSNGYIMGEKRKLKFENGKNYDILRNQILENSPQPSKIILSAFPDFKNKKMQNDLKKKILTSLDVIESDYNFEDNHPKCIAAIVKHMFDQKFNDFHIFQKCICSFAISTNPSFQNAEDALIFTNENDVVPLEMSCTVPRNNTTFYVSYLNIHDNKYKNVRKCEPNASTILDYHKIKLTFFINENSVPFLYQEKVNVPSIETFPTKLNQIQDLDIPVIGFFDNSAVICIKNENGYEFLKSWNGLYGNDLFLSFHQEIPTVITEINVQSHSKTVIKASDILKVMSMPYDNVIIDQKWNLKITKDDDNPILLEFENFDGVLASSPTLLMAFIIKELRSTIKKAIGKKPMKLGIFIFDKFYKAAKKNRLQCQLQEACNLLKIDSQIL